MNTSYQLSLNKSNIIKHRINPTIAHSIATAPIIKGSRRPGDSVEAFLATNKTALEVLAQAGSQETRDFSPGFFMVNGWLMDNKY